MASSNICSISKRQRRRPRVPDLRHRIASRQVSLLRQQFVGVLGAEGTGRHTLVRRFLHMGEGQFDHPEPRRDRTRSILVNLATRPYIRRPETVHLLSFIFNDEECDFETMFLTIARVHAIVVMFDVTDDDTLLPACRIMVKITDELRRPPRFIFVGNKSDLQNPEVDWQRARSIAFQAGAERYYECSAKMDYNVERVLDAVLLMPLYPYATLPH